MARPRPTTEVRRCLAALALCGVWSQHARIEPELDMAKQLKALYALDAVGAISVPPVLWGQVVDAVAKHGGRLASELLDRQGES